MHLMHRIFLLIFLVSTILPAQGLHVGKILTYGAKKAAAVLLSASALASWNYRARIAHAQEQPKIQSGFCEKRPEKVQEMVDRAFEANKDNTTWGLYNGSDWYGPIGID